MSVPADPGTRSPDLFRADVPRRARSRLARHKFEAGMASFISQAENYLADLEAHIAKLEEESAQKDAEIRRLLMRSSAVATELKRETT